jgi:hypothetical protein
MLSINIASRTLEELTAPLGYAQIAPVPFLWAERVMVSAFGVNEWILRALPLVAGAAVCLAIFLVGRRILQPSETIVALALSAFSPVLIRYSAEVKPYSWDALLALVMVGVTVPLLTPSSTPVWWNRLAIVGGVAALSSLASPFVCLGVVSALMAWGLLQRRLDLFARSGLLALLWGALFLAPYQLLYREEARAPYMRVFWQGSFLVPGSPQVAARARVALVEATRILDAGWTLLGLSAVVLGLLFLGTVGLWRRRGVPHVLLLLVPALAPFAASAVGAYPIAARLILFAAPLAIMLVAIGVIEIAQAIHRLLPSVPSRWVTALLLLPAVTTALASLLVPRDQQLRPLVSELQQRWCDNEPVYVFHRIVPAWLFYTTDWTAPDLKQVDWVMRISGPGGLGHENGPSRGSRRPGEGRDLIYELNGHPILLGTSSGVQGRPMVRPEIRGPDPGWATNEVERMRTASSVVWLILGHAADGVDLGRGLLDAAGQAGAQLTFQDSLLDGRLYRLDFERGGGFRRIRRAIGDTPRASSAQ